MTVQTGDVKGQRHGGWRRPASVGGGQGGEKEGVPQGGAWISSPRSQMDKVLLRMVLGTGRGWLC